MDREREIIPQKGQIKENQEPIAKTDVFYFYQTFRYQGQIEIYLVQSQGENRKFMNRYEAKVTINQSIRYI